MADESLCLQRARNRANSMVSITNCLVRVLIFWLTHRHSDSSLLQLIARPIEVPGESFWRPARAAANPGHYPNLLHRLNHSNGPSS